MSFPYPPISLPHLHGEGVRQPQKDFLLGGSMLCQLELRHSVWAISPGGDGRLEVRAIDRNQVWTLSSSCRIAQLPGQEMHSAISKGVGED